MPTARHTTPLDGSSNTAPCPELRPTTHRRGFLGTLAASGLALTTLGLPFRLSAAPSGIDTSHDLTDDPDAWFGKLKGKHRLVIDVPHQNEIFPFAWSKIFLVTNAATGSPAKDINVVVVLRHEGIPYAFDHRIWEKYKFGEVFKITDPKTKAPSTRNMFWKPNQGDFQIPGIGNVDIGIDQLQDNGVMFCVCDMAMTVYSAALAAGINASPADVKTEWLSGLLPGIQPVPSGVWAVGRAQEHGCNYCFAG